MFVKSGLKVLVLKITVLRCFRVIVRLTVLSKFLFIRGPKLMVVPSFPSRQVFIQVALTWRRPVVLFMTTFIRPLLRTKTPRGV